MKIILLQILNYTVQLLEKCRHKLLTIKSINILKKLNTRLDYLDLELDLGLEDAILTTELITLISIVINCYISKVYFF